MANDADVVIIGSGFGGAITAARLAERGYKVIVLERGRRWGTKYPRAINDPWVWDPAHPEQRNGWFDFRIFPHMTVVQGAGVGGGSLVYANISIEAKPDTFNAGWPAEITFAELGPYYKAVGTMLNVQPVPIPQWPERTKMIQEGAQNLGHADRFRALDLAVTFSDKWSYDLPDPHNQNHSETVHQRARRRAGHLRASRQLRCRLRGQGAQHARSELHSARRTERRGRAPLASGREDRADGGWRWLRRLVRSARYRCPRPRHAHGADRHRRRRLDGIERAAAEVPRPASHAAADQSGARQGLEQQRRLPHAVAASVPHRSIRPAGRPSRRRSICSTAR